MVETVSGASKLSIYSLDLVMVLEIPSLLLFVMYILYADYNTSSNTQIRNDYIYILDPETMTWSNRTLSNASGINGPSEPLSGHQG